jgi:hypothetical protein
MVFIMLVTSRMVVMTGRAAVYIPVLPLPEVDNPSITQERNRSGV